MESIKKQTAPRGRSKQKAASARAPKVKLFCEMCHAAKRNEPLWYINDKFYCSYCGMVTLVNSNSKEVKEGGFVGQDRKTVISRITGKTTGVHL